MINEILEFKAYVISPESDLPRIQPKMFTNNFSSTSELYGLEHILTMIARGFIFGNYSEDGIFLEDGSVNEQQLETIKSVLFRWLGFDCVKKYEADGEALEKWYEKYPQADAWLKKYYRKHCGRKDKAKLWSKLEEKWSDSLQGGDYKASQYSMNDVIANALAHGALKEQCMLIKKDSVDIKSAKLKERLKYLYRVEDHGRQTSLQEKTVERLLKNIAAYLYLRSNHPRDQKYVLLNRIQLLCWYGLDDNKNESGSWYFSKCVFGEEDHAKPIMTAVSSQRGWKFIKLMIDDEFISKFDIRLIDVNEMDAVDREKYWIMKDHGHGVGSLRCVE
jgi:hypothetical protein